MFAWNPGALNPEQEAAIREVRNVFLVACPGSGKTRTLTYKIASQLSQMKSAKQWVVAITYTHRAADEIHERVENLGVDTSRLWIGTIHSFCLEWILRPYAIYHEALRFGFKVINSHDTEEILTDLCSPYRKERITYWDCNYYYTSKGRILACSQGAKLPFINDILDLYSKTLLANRQVDYELILRYAHDLIVQMPSISKLLGSLFSYVLVDEYQDTKEIQYSIIGAILRAGSGKVSTFIVGDPNQAIYGSLGGFAITPGEFGTMAGIEFAEMGLSLNYRSSDRIVSYFGNYQASTTTISSVGENKDYASLVSFDNLTLVDNIENELVRLIKYNIETVGIRPHNVCVLAPQWVHLASMTRRLVAAMPEYSFDGPGMVPFARDVDNFWYKLSRIILTEASPRMYIRRLRWASEIIAALSDADVDVAKLSRKSLLRCCNSIDLDEKDGLAYLKAAFAALFAMIEIDFRAVPTLLEHHSAFFESSQQRIARLAKDGATFIGDISTFRRVFENRSGITVSTIHGVKGAEFDAVIAYALLDGMVPHFNDPNGPDSAKRLLYVICSRARKNLHLVAERGRMDGRNQEYRATTVLAKCRFAYNKI